jgi:non-heme chloroperoxidase
MPGESNSPKRSPARLFPDAAAGQLLTKLLKNGTLKIYKGYPHGMPTTQTETINADLLAFIKS